MSKCLCCGKEHDNKGMYCELCLEKFSAERPKLLQPDTFVPLGLEMGWVCPKCGAVMSPRQQYCIFCLGNDKSITVGLTATWDKSDSLDPNF